MLKFKVPDMTCGHCASTVTGAIKTVDPAATVEIDLEGQQVSINSSADAAKLSSVIEEAGYSNQPA